MSLNLSIKFRKLLYNFQYFDTNSHFQNRILKKTQLLPYSNMLSETSSTSFSIPTVNFWLQKSMSIMNSNVRPTLPTSTQQDTAVQVFLMLQLVVPRILNSGKLAGHSLKLKVNSEFN